MGAMAVKYGFFGDPEASTGGESLLLADKEEQWIFHVLAEDEKKGGAIWGAQRMPRDHITVVSNAFVIGFMNASDSDNFLFSDNMHSVAKANGWWDGTGMLHWTRAFSGGEYTSRYYAGRRMWTVYDQLAKSQKVPAQYDNYREAIGTTYPTSAPADAKVVREDVLRKVYRNYYQGTPYDLGVGPASGAFGNPARWKPGKAEAGLGGYFWERPIASFRTTMIYQTNLRPSEPAARRNVVWHLPGAALGGVFTPTFVNTTEVGHAQSAAHNTQVDRRTSMWAFRNLVQFAYPRWDAVKGRIAEVASKLEAQGATLVANLDKGNGDVTAPCSKNQDAVVTAWQQLYDELLVKYSDGWNYQNLEAGRVGYPEWWLKEVGYTAGFESKDRPHPCNPTCP
jgi:dipeptidase